MNRIAFLCRDQVPLHRSSASFPRNTVAHLAFAQGMFTAGHYVCGHHVMGDGAWELVCASPSLPRPISFARPFP